MPLDFDPFLTDFRTQIKSAWPEVSGVYDGEAAARIAWPALTLPYAVLLVADWPEPGALSETWGVNNLVFEPLVSVFYVNETAIKSTALRAKLMTLVNRLWPHDPLTTGQVLGIGKVSVGDHVDANQAFTAANREQRVGLVEVRCLLGVTNQ